MSDDHNSRYRQDTSGHGPNEAANDPLAELARLIGRSDPFAELREARPPAPREEHEPPRFVADPPPSAEPEPRDTPHRTQSYESGGNLRYDDDGWPATPHHPQPQPPAYSSDPFALPTQPQSPTAPAPAEQHYTAPPFPELRARLGMEGERTEHPFEAAAFPPEQEHPPLPQALYPDDPHGGSMPPPHGDDFYDDAPRGGRRKGLMTVAAVLALAVVGTAGAFGYRSLFGGGHASPPPVIRASGEPSKVAPPPAETDQSSNKITYDRFADRGKDEQVVVREEKPVDSKELASASAPRTAFPPPPASNAGQPAAAGPASGAANATTANPPSALGEPRRVRTVQIRPDQPLPVAPQVGGAAPTLPMAPPAASQNEAGASAPPPPAPAPPPQQAATRGGTSSHAMTRNTRVAARSAPPPEPVANAPLSLSPDASDRAPPPPAAARDNSPRPLTPPRVASVASSGEAGGYLVQVSSRRSEADAESSLRALQAKYASVLGGQPHLVRRADLGAKGIYYRAMVGPFGSREQAIQLCSSLKAAGGDCVVQSN